MSMKFKDNQIRDFDVQATFGKMEYLEHSLVFEQDSDGKPTTEVREIRMTVYSEEKADQIDITLPSTQDFSAIKYDDEIELVGEVTATGWLSSYKDYRDNVRSEQAFKIRAEGVRKLGYTQPEQQVTKKEKEVK